MQGQQILICKNCGSNKVKVTCVSNWTMTTIIGFIIVIVAIWIPVIGWFIGIPFGLFLIVIGIIGRIIQAIIKHPQNANVTCEACHHSWKVSQAVYLSYKEAIK